MTSLTSFLLLCLFIIIIVCCYHLFCWNYSYGVYATGARAWISPFECGFLSRGLAESSFSFTYFTLLVFFILFDLEVSLLLNLPFQGVLFKNMFYYVFFIILLSLGYIIEVAKGYVSWGY